MKVHQYVRSSGFNGRLFFNVAVLVAVLSSCTNPVRPGEKDWTPEIYYPLSISGNHKIVLAGSGMGEASNFSRLFTHYLFFGNPKSLFDTVPGTNVRVNNGTLFLQLGTPRNPPVFFSPMDLCVFEITDFSTSGGGSWYSLSWEEDNDSGRIVALMWSNKDAHVKTNLPRNEADEPLPSPQFIIDWKLQKGWNFIIPVLDEETGDIISRTFEESEIPGTFKWIVRKTGNS